ncbi:MAG: hypothetical protein R3B70_00945 [Polyangiaceae bacterium]
MTESELLDRFGVSPAEADLDEIRSLLHEHAARERDSQGEGDTEVMKLCCVQLFSVGLLEEAVLWRGRPRNAVGARLYPA